MEREQINWITASASVTGNGHLRNGQVCQDSHIQQPVNKDWGIAIVSDGAGSAKYSDIGSDFIVRNTAHCLEELVNRKVWDTASFPTAEEWRTEVLVVLQIVRQRLGQFAERQNYTIADLAATVMAVLYSPFGLLVVHIGDGRGAYSQNGAEWKALIEPFRGSEVNETVFFTSGIWTKEGLETYVQTSVVNHKVKAFAIMTDGCEKGAFEVNIYDEEQGKYIDPNRPYNKFFTPNIKGLEMMYRDGLTAEQINEEWAKFLTAGTKVFKHEIDDKTMILATKI